MRVEKRLCFCTLEKLLSCNGVSSCEEKDPNVSVLKCTNVCESGSIRASVSTLWNWISALGLFCRCSGVVCAGAFVCVCVCMCVCVCVCVFEVLLSAKRNRFPTHSEPGRPRWPALGLFPAVNPSAVGKSACLPYSTMKHCTEHNDNLYGNYANLTDIMWAQNCCSVARLWAQTGEPRTLTWRLAAQSSINFSKVRYHVRPKLK